MESPLSSLTFNALQGRPIPETHSANHDLARLVTRKWEIYAGHREHIHTSSMDDLSFFLQKKKGGNLEKIVFQGDVHAAFATLGMSNRRERISFKARNCFKVIGSPMCLYRLGCTFPSGVHIEPSDKSAWWSGFIHKATGRSSSPQTVQEQSDLEDRFVQDGQWQLFQDLAGLSDSVGRTISQPYLEELPKELVDHLSDPDTGDAVVLKKMQDFVDTNNIFTSDIAELLSYLASDQCAHGYGDLVAGCEERES